MNREDIGKIVNTMVVLQKTEKAVEAAEWTKFEELHPETLVELAQLAASVAMSCSGIAASCCSAIEKQLPGTDDTTEMPSIKQAVSS